MVFVHPLRAAHASPSLREGVLCTTTVIPAKAGIQRGGARAVHAEARHRAVAPNSYAKNPKGRETACFVFLWVPASAGMTG